MELSKGKAGDLCEASVVAAHHVGGRARATGLWDVAGWGPVVLRDGAKFLVELAKTFGDLPEAITPIIDLAIEQNKLHYVRAERMITRFGNDARRLLDLHIDREAPQLFFDHSHNLIVDVGCTDILEKYFRGSTYTAAWYIGLVSSSPTVAAGDTMSSHAGWTEVTTYSESVRQTYSPAAAASKSITNSASKATFSINGTVTVGGAFNTTSNTKSGTTGTLYSATAFSGGNRSLVNGDSLQVTSTYTQADDGV